MQKLTSPGVNYKKAVLKLQIQQELATILQGPQTSVSNQVAAGLASDFDALMRELRDQIISAPADTAKAIGTPLTKLIPRYLCA